MLPTITQVSDFLVILQDLYLKSLQMFGTHYNPRWSQFKQNYIKIPYYYQTPSPQSILLAMQFLNVFIYPIQTAFYCIINLTTATFTHYISLKLLIFTQPEKEKASYPSCPYYTTCKKNFFFLYSHYTRRTVISSQLTSP